MDPDELPDAEDLWWSWVLLAALHRAVGDTSCRFDPDDHVLSLDAADGSWLRMQRTHGRRTTLWGRSAQAPASPPDARRGAPDWALSEATEDCRPTFLAWHVHGEWDTSAPCHDEGAIHLLRPLLTVDPRAVALVRTARRPRRPWRRTPTASTSRRPPSWYAGPAHRLLAAREAPSVSGCATRSTARCATPGEADRMLMQRPPTLVHWSRINGPAVPFEYAVMVMRDRLSPAPTNTRLPAASERSLTNVLSTLHREEASEESGAWLFARVTSDGVVVRFDRAFDSWPAWYQVNHASQGPSLEDLAWEMGQRSPHVAARLGEPAPPRLTAGGAGQSSRRSVAHRVSSCREDSCSLRSTEDMWVSTVLIEMNSSEPTSL